jgi:ADP-heptose:LPS heptosyltransferase
MIAALRKARERHDFDVALCGGPSDAEQLEAIARQLGDRTEVLAGQLSVPGLAAFLAHCAALFTLDSGPRHIGNAAGVPVIFARNMSHSRVEAGRYSATETDIAPEGEFLTDAAISRVAAMQPLEPVAEILVRTLRSRGQRA